MSDKSKKKSKKPKLKLVVNNRKQWQAVNIKPNIINQMRQLDLTYRGKE